ncbi:MAG: universal stress protein [Gammaproteobacteria bacterium]
MYNHILVPVDGSSTSDLAVQEAIKLAKDQQQTQLRFVHVVEEARVFWYGEGYSDIVSLQTSLREAGKNILGKAETLAQQAGVTSQTKLLDADGERTARVIVEEAQSWPADVVVMGTHGRRGFDHLIFGSVAEGVVRIAPMPILLIRGAKKVG